MPTLRNPPNGGTQIPHIQIKAKSQFEFVWREHEESELFDLVNFGDVAF